MLCLWTYEVITGKAYIYGRRCGHNDVTQPADYFAKAKSLPTDSLITATVQQSIYRLGDPNVALSKVFYRFMTSQPGYGSSLSSFAKIMWFHTMRERGIRNGSLKKLHR